MRAEAGRRLWMKIALAGAVVVMLVGIHLTLSGHRDGERRAKEREAHESGPQR